MPAADHALDARLYLITGARPDLDAFLEAAVRGGVDLVQLREKSLADAAVLSVLEEAREITRRLGVPLVSTTVPTWPSLVGADYVHVGQDDMPAAAARRFGLPVACRPTRLPSSTAAEPT